MADTVSEEVRINGITEGVIWKELLKFSAPLLVGNLFQQLYNTVDSIVVGNFVGSDALAAVGSSMVIINLLIGLFMGIAAGAGVLVSQYYGAKDERGVQGTMHTGLMSMFYCGIIITILGIIAAPWIVHAIGTPPEVEKLSVLYLRIFFLGSIPLVIYNMGAGLLRAVGDSKRPLYFLIVACITNIVLDLVLVVVFHLGVAGVAIATGVAQAVSAILVMYVLMHDDDIYRVHLKKLKVQKNYLLSIIRIGLPSGIQQSVISFSNIIVQSKINLFGAAAMAGYSAYNKVDTFIMLPFMSIGLASTTFVGQNIGAKKWQRVRKSANTSILMSASVTIVLSALVFLFGTKLIGLFTQEPEVIDYGHTMLLWMAPFYVLCCFTNICSGIIRGAGEATIPMFIMVGNYCVVRIIWLAIMTRLFHSIDIVFAGYPVTWLTAAVIMAIYYKKGNWLSKYTGGERLPD